MLGLRACLANDPSQTSEGFITLRTSRKLLVAAISGGSSSSVSASAVLTLSAAGSFDPDVISGSNDPPLIFSWACTPPGGDVGWPCQDRFGRVLVLPLTAQLVLPPLSLLPAQSPYVFQVTVSKQWRSPATATVAVFATDWPTAIVLFTSGTCSRSESNSQPCCPASGDGSVILANPSSRLSFKASAVLDGNIQGALRWDLFAAAGDTALALDIADAPIGLASDSFVLQGSVALLTPGGTYRVRASAVDAAGWAEQILAVNRPPAGGTCTACLVVGPIGECLASGLALADIFRLSCVGWADPDGTGQLEYRFGYSLSATDSFSSSSNSTNSNSTWQVVWLDWGADEWRDVALPAGQVVVLAQVILRLILVYCSTLQLAVKLPRKLSFVSYIYP